MNNMLYTQESRNRPYNLLLFFILSLVIHLALVLSLPDLTRLFKIHLNSLALLNEAPIVVDLVKVRVEPEPPPEPKEKPRPYLVRCAQGIW